MQTKDLKERRASVVQEMREITDNPKADNGDLSSEQAEKFEQLRAENESLEKRIERQEAVNDAERRANGETLAGTDEKWAEKRRSFSLVNALAGSAGFDVDDGNEREIGQEIARRTGRAFQGTAVPVEVFEERVATTSSAGDLVSEDHLGNQFIDRLRENVLVRRLGARVLRGLTGNVDIPRLTGSATVGWVAENSALSASDHTFDSVQLSPKHAGALTELSRNMLQQSSPDIEQLVRNDFAQILGSALDQVAINGGGSDEPTGILANGSVSSVDMASGAQGVDWNSLQDLIGLLEDADAEGSAFLTNPKVVRVLRTTEKVSGTPEHGFIMDGRNNLDGYGVSKTTNVPVTSGSPDTSELIFGNFRDLLIGFWSELDVLTNPYESTAYSKGNVQVRAMMTADVALRHAASFAYGTNIDVS
jgi:HK97 family phage major capsid protein